MGRVTSWFTAWSIPWRRPPAICRAQQAPIEHPPPPPKPYSEYTKLTYSPAKSPVMDRPPPRGPRGGGGGGGRRGGAGAGAGAGGRDNERYGGRATDPNHSSRKRSRSRSPESRNYRENYRERDGRGEREYPKHDGGRGGDRGTSPITFL